MVSLNLGYVIVQDQSSYFCDINLVFLWILQSDELNGPPLAKMQIILDILLRSYGIWQLQFKLNRPISQISFCKRTFIQTLWGFYPPGY